MYWIAFMSPSDCELNVMMQKIRTCGKIQVKHSYLISAYENEKSKKNLQLESKVFPVQWVIRFQARKNANLNI